MNSVSAYQNADVWKEFYIVGIDDVNIEQYEVEAVKIYPNPAEDYLYVSNASCVKNYTVFDLSGRPVLSGNVSASAMPDTYINIASLSGGVYMIRFTKTDGNTESQKFVKL